VKILFTLAHGYLPQGNGGLQKSIDQLSRQLMKKGHRIAVLASLMHGGSFALAAKFKLKVNQIAFGRRLSRDTTLGYPVWRTWFPWGRPGHMFPDKEIAYVIAREQPDLVVIASGEAVRVARAVKSTGVPILMHLVDVEFKDHSGAFGELGNVPCIANSRFTAEQHRRAFGVDPLVIYPLMPREDYLTDTTRENVTFINPSKQKGLELALGIARLCPEIPFSFNETWPVPEIHRRRFIESNLRGLPNVMLTRPQQDMRNVYGRCKILLAPSVWPEGYGRVATEAQISGIPVVASTRGGLPEAVGPGGILLDVDRPITDWAAAVRKLWIDPHHYAQLSAAAFTHAQRRELALPYQIDAWEQALVSAAGHSSTPPGKALGSKVHGRT
jgi:glycosyltransferase involved in cell wall biosynthesis